jgi:hypothetical protein
MKSIIAASFAACLAMSAGVASAADNPTNGNSKMDARKDMSMQDCKDHMNEMKGQKRTDPPTADTTTKCGDMKTGGMKHGKTGADGMKSGSGSSMGTSGTTPATGTGTTSGTSAGATGTGPATPTK